MNHQYAKSILCSCFTLVLSISATMVKAEPVQWPAGTNVCQGVWSYSEYEACEDASHGSDLDRPIIAEKDGKQCGYDKIKNSCWHGREHDINNFVDTPVERLARDTRDYSARDLQAHCEKKGQAIQLKDQQLLGEVSVLGSKVYPKICLELEGRICMIWGFRADVQCRIKLDHQIFGASDDCGAYIDDLSNPKTCTIGYYNIKKRSSACKSVDYKTSRSLDASELMREDWRYGFACSTGDQLPAETNDDVQKKYTFLVKKIQETLDPAQADFEILTRALTTLLDQRSQFLDAAQISYASKVASKEMKSSKRADGVAFDVATDCASNGSGQSRFCPNKRIFFDFGDTVHLPRIASYTSMAHRLRFSFPCDVNPRQLSVKLIEGDDDFSLAPTLDGSVQSTTIVYLQGQRPPQLEIIADRNALFPDSCKLNVQWSSLDLDPTLLLNSSNNLIEKIGLLASFKSEIQKAAQLPAKFNVVQSLKANLGDTIIGEIFQCQDLATAAGKDPELLCPLNDDPKWACINAPLTETGQLDVVMKQIRENSCLYRDLEEGLPSIVPCSAGGDQCLEGIQKVAGLAELEYQKSRSSALSLMDDLKIERTRIVSKQVDLAKKIDIVIDSLNKGLSQPASSGAALRNRRAKRD